MDELTFTISEPSDGGMCLKFSDSNTLIYSEKEWEYLCIAMEAMFAQEPIKEKQNEDSNN